MNEPNWDRLREIAAEVERLIADGKWTKDEYERLLAEAETAANGNAEFVEFIVNEGAQFG